MKKYLSFLIILTILFLGLETRATAKSVCDFMEGDPSITILSPKGGETYIAGQTFTTTWTSCNIPTTASVQILLKSKSSSGPLTSSSVKNFDLASKVVSGSGLLNSGSATFTLPTDWSEIKSGMQYKVSISSSQSGKILAYDLSKGTFTIKKEGEAVSNSTVFSRNLIIGSKGDDVKKLQEFLIEKGYLASGNNIGYFGKLTSQALGKYQKDNGISPTGTVGPITRNLLNNSL
jgi:hypothetical protein